MKPFPRSISLVILVSGLVPTGVFSQTSPPPPSIPQGSGTNITPVLPASTRSTPGLSNLNKSDYILGPGDQLKVDMFGQTNLFTTPYTVLVDGTISMPFIGQILVAGKTIQDVESQTTNRYKRFFKRPYLTIALVKPRQLTLAVSGEVLKPGTYPFTSADQIPTVTQLVKLAGGMKPSGDLRKVQIRRTRFGQGNAYELVSIDLVKLLQNGDLAQDLKLRDGDVVMIPPATTASLEDFTLAANSNIATDTSDPLKIAIVGEVFRPGPYLLQGGNATVGQAGTQGQTTSIGGRNLPTVSQAIQIAGGIRPDANIREIKIRRITSTGTEQFFTVDMRRMLLEGDIKQDIPLQQGDTVIVAKSATPLTPEELQFMSDITLAPATIDVNVVGEVNRPGMVKIKPNTPLNTAVFAAGGFNNQRANKKRVRLLRLTPDGKVSERKIKLSLSEPINEKTNPPLRNNDVVIVDRSRIAAFSDTSSAIFSPVTSTLNVLQLFDFDSDD
jgi:polysaccharide biosynthesis/export protein